MVIIIDSGASIKMKKTNEEQGKGIPPPTSTSTSTIAPEEEVQQLKGKSWFDVEEEYRDRTGRKSLTKIIFTSLVDQKSCVVSKIHDLFTQFNDRSGDDNDSDGNDDLDKVHGGVVLISNGGNNVGVNDEEFIAALGFLETDSPSTAHECLSQLSTSGPSIGLHSIRILLVSDDCPCHDFGAFGIYIASPPTEDNVDVEKEGPSTIFVDIMTKLCKHSLTFPSEAKEHETILDAKLLSGLHRKAVPSATRIKSCAESDAYPTLEEYLDIYHSPIYLELDSEHMSPLLPVIDWKKVENIASSFLNDEKNSSN